MKTTYLIWKHPKCNGVSPHWLEITGQEFFALMKSPESTGRYFIRLNSTDLNGEDGAFVLEATHEQYIAWKKEHNHTDYLQRIASGVVEISYHALFDVGEVDEMLLIDTSCDIEEAYIQSQEATMLYAVLEQMEEDERAMLEYLYLADERGTERGYASLEGISNATVHRRKITILEKIKKFFED